MSITKHIPKIIATGLALERVHNTLIDFSPRYRQFVHATTDNVKNRLGLRRTIGDEIREHLNIPRNMMGNFIHIEDGYFWKFEIMKLFQFDRFYSIRDDIIPHAYSVLFDTEIKVDGWSKSNEYCLSSKHRLYGWAVLVPDELRDEDEEILTNLNPMTFGLMFGESNGRKCVLYSFTSGQRNHDQGHLLIVNDDDLKHFAEIVADINNKNNLYNPYRRLVVQLEPRQLMANVAVSEAVPIEAQEGPSYQQLYQDYIKHNICISNVESEDLRYHKKEINLDLYSEEVKEFLTDDFLEFIKRQSDLEEKGFDGRRSYLLAGPPGSGKTNIIKSMIRLLPNDYTVIFVAAQGISSLSLLQNAKNVRPIMVVIEDVDLMINDKYERRELLNFLDGVTSPSDMITVLTANNPETLAGALVERPGRVDRICYVMAGDLNSRAMQITALTNGISLPSSALELAKSTEGLTFAHHRELVRRALIYSKTSDSISLGGWKRASEQCTKQFKSKIEQWKQQ